MIIGLFLSFIAFLAYLFITQANVEQVSYIKGCNSDNVLTVYCNFQNPEDLAAMPDDENILVSEFGAIIPLSPMNIAGRFSLLNTKSGNRHILEINRGKDRWGSDDCERNSFIFSPHGIDINQRISGSHQLAVVNHMPNETIEMFELIQNDGQWSLLWNGCIAAPPHGYFNDVALKTDGSFFVSQMYDKETSLLKLAVLDSTKGHTGYVYHWTKENGFKKVINTDGAFPNGVELSDDEESLFVNYAFGNKTSKYNFKSKKIEANFNINGIPDNITIDGDYLWVGGQDHSGLDSLIYCGAFAHEIFEDPEVNQCPLPFAAYKLNQSDLSLVEAFEYSNTVMGAATVALSLNKKLYFGTYHGDRIASVDLTKE
jgi:hypothetical protein|tara:strand:- start:9142 stop:10254 length:1113 start_codon:yes stop_codon:yes gene_type:complete